MDAILTCPICYSFIGFPIYGCQNGHILCEPCLKILRNDEQKYKCSICNHRGFPFRNLSLEQLLEKEKIACEDCKEDILLSSYNKHPEICARRSHICPFNDENCSWTYKPSDFKKSDLIEEILSHAKQHNANIVYDQKFNADYYLSIITFDEIKKNDNTTIVSCIDDQLLFINIIYTFVPKGINIRFKAFLLNTLSDTKNYIVGCTPYGTTPNLYRFRKLFKLSSFKNSEINNQDFLIDKIIGKNFGYVIKVRSDSEIEETNCYRMIQKSQSDNKSWYFTSPAVQFLNKEIKVSIEPKNRQEDQVLGTAVVLKYLVKHYPQKNELIEEAKQYLSKDDESSIKEFVKSSLL